MTERRYFDHPTAAVRYAAARPYVHPQIVQRMAALMQCDHFGTALDVGCGTGQSTQALAAIADSVIGVDQSEAMLACADPHSSIAYHVGTAESLPVADGSAELITVGLAWHWLDPLQFLAEVQRVLRSGGWLAIYNSAFNGDVPARPSFRDWHLNDYLKTYPSPARQTRLPDTFPLHEFGLTHQRRDQFVVTAVMSHGQFVEYLLTQTNIIAVVEKGTLSLDAVRERLRRETEVLFAGESVEIPFRADLHLLRKE